MNLRNTLISVAAAATLMGSVAKAAAAQSTATSSLTIGGGSFSASKSASNFGDLPFSLIDQYARNGSITLVVSDMTGDGNGWIVTLDISNFVGSDRPSEFIISDNLEIGPEVITVQTGADGTAPWSAATMPIVYGESDPELTWPALPGYGAGSYILTMMADLLVPGQTTAQTYTSTGTVTATSAP